MGQNQKLDPAEIVTCIWCGDTHPRAEMTDEHSVPEGLGGKDYYVDGSCQRCQNITTKLELEVLRKELQNVRAFWGFPNNNKKKKTPKLKMTVEGRFGSTWKTVDLPIKDLRAIGVIPEFVNRPRLLGPASSYFDWFDFQTMIFGSTKSFYVNHGFQEIRIPSMTMRMDFICRLLAKIAHVHACKHVGMDKFHALLWPVVKGDEDRLPFFVGASRILDGSSRMHSVTHYWASSEGMEFLCVSIRLFKSWAFPTYEVVVGNRKSHSSEALDLSGITGLSPDGGNSLFRELKPAPNVLM